MNIAESTSVSPQKWVDLSQPTCATKFIANITNPRNDIVLLAVVPPVIATGILLLPVIVVLTCVVTHYKKRKVTECDPVAYMDPIFQDNLVVLQYNTCYHQFNHESCMPVDPEYLHLMASRNSYVINSLEEFSNAESYEPQYWQPASKEVDLKIQLKKLKVNEVPNNEIE